MDTNAGSNYFISHSLTVPTALTNCMRISSPLFVSTTSTTVFGQWMYLTALFFLLGLLRLSDTQKYRIRRILDAITVYLLCAVFGGSKAEVGDP